MIFRSKEAKNDPVRSWNRPDRPFFAAGACHILAGAFMEAYPNAGFVPLLIWPDSGFRGCHVIVSNGCTTFDYHGYASHDIFIEHHFAKMRRFFPGWQAQIVPLNDSPSGESFCQKYQHRLPHQYLHDPRPRARAYLRRFAEPS